MKKYYLPGLLVLGLFGVFLYYSPQIDLNVSLLAYNMTTTRFYGEVSTWCTIIYWMVPCLTVSFVLLSVLTLIFNKKMPNPHAARKGAVIVLLALAIGPGLVVNTIFKDGWGRPRPYQVIRDHQEFAPVWKADFNAPKNNSFPGGHASIGFFLGVPFLAMGFRRRGLVVSAIGGFVVSLVRVLQGGHFVSDVVFSGIFVWRRAELVVWLINYLDQRYSLLGRT